MNRDPNKIRNLNAFMNEGPTVIGMMASVIEGGGSLDTAARDVAANGPARSSSMFREMVTKADTRQIPDIGYGMSELLSALPADAAPFRRSMQMVISASGSQDRSERDRMLKDASDISLNGLRETGESYSTSLNIPCMMIFGLGIMVPMILMSILPMLSIGGMFGSSTISMVPIVLITLVIIPCVIISLIISVKEKNPFISSGPLRSDPTALIPLLSMVPIAIVLMMITYDASTSIMMAAIISGIISIIVIMPSVRSGWLREKQESLLQDSVFELGNRLIGGENFEKAIVEAVSVRKECTSIAEGISRELDLCRGDVCAAIRSSIERISESVSGVFCDIYRCSLKDIRDSGRLAISIGRQLQDQNSVRKNIKNKLKSMTDMMTGTAAVFAPLVLGMSVTMLGPKSKVAEGVDTEGTSTILIVYLIELCILMAVLTSCLAGKYDAKEMVFKAGMMLPASIVIFILCSSIGL